MTATCKTCGEKIPAARLAALPGVDTCKLHSEAVAYTERDIDCDTSDAADLCRMVGTPRSEN